MVASRWRGARKTASKNKTSMKGKKTKAATKYARLSTFTKGMIWGMKLAGMERSTILLRITKRDCSKATLKAVDDTIAKKTADPDWEGEVHHPGRQEALTEKELKKVVRFVFKHRGSAKVTSVSVKKSFGSCAVSLNKPFPGHCTQLG